MDPSTGVYTAFVRSPTGLPTDPALSAHGVAQSHELASHLATLDDPPIDRVYSSPYYRCLQTLAPYIRDRQRREREGERGGKRSGGRGRDDEATATVKVTRIRPDPGFGEWYGASDRFEHPTSAEPAVLAALFPDEYDAGFAAAAASSSSSLAPPSRSGETIEQLHDRVAAAAEALVATCDAEGVRGVLLCSHAAVVIALGRVLTGRMPESVEEEDFGAFTCGLSVYRRSRKPEGSDNAEHRRQREDAQVDGSKSPGHHAGGGTSRELRGDDDDGSLRREPPTSRALRGGHDDASQTQSNPSADPSIMNTDARKSARHKSALQTQWADGLGVAGGWICEVNCDCSFLSAGPERGW